MSHDTKSLIKIILVLELIVLVIGMFFIKNPLSYALGILLGTAVSAARLVLLERALNKAVDMSPTDAQNYTRLQYSLRMIGILAIAFAAIK
ncbi:MAG: ATP synthase subunit I, partial [Firmicutes bacterium]|nr:ATP synthase subunit I [Bacillota bacterium]